MSDINDNDLLPRFEFDLGAVSCNLAEFRGAFWFLNRTHYAIKANPWRPILETLISDGCDFEIASTHELHQLLAAGFPRKRVGRVIFSNPTRDEAEIIEAYKLGARVFVVDSESELRKFLCLEELDRHKVKILLRLATVEGAGEVHSEGKAGASGQEAVELLCLAKGLGMRPYGLTFHAGSQQTNPQAWVKAITDCGQVIRTMRDRHKIRLELINLGGGVPVEYDQPVPSWGALARVIWQALKLHILSLYSPDLPPQLVAEPGRAIVASSGRLITKVINARRCAVCAGGDRTCQVPGRLTVQGGVFHGLMEGLESGAGLGYPVLCSRLNLTSSPWKIYGWSCDSQDLILRSVRLPSFVQEGDRLVFLNVGAYSTAYMGPPGEEGFNGLPNPHVISRDWTKPKNRRKEAFT